MKKKNILIIFGGQSSEHEVSCVSATTIVKNMDTNQYNPILVGITKEGSWLLFDRELEELTKGTWSNNCKQVLFSPQAIDKSIFIIDNEKINKIKIDIVFPALHGLYGEDGTIQGLFELAKIPYVGCGVLASSVSMDKAYTKIIVDTLDVRQAKYITVNRIELKYIDKIVENIENQFSYPIFIKPSNAGSSVGITKAHNKDELIKGLNLAAENDRKILVEETIKGREIECAVLGNEEPKASGLGEIVAAAEFYDYDAKYNNSQSKTILNPELPEETIKEIKEAAVNIFKAVDGSGLSRVDFFVEDETNEVVFNEINTLPGFTSISMYPMLWQEQGINISELIDELIKLAIERSCS